MNLSTPNWVKLCDGNSVCPTSRHVKSLYWMFGISLILSILFKSLVLCTESKYELVYLMSYTVSFMFSILILHIDSDKSPNIKAILGENDSNGLPTINIIEDME